MGTLATRIGGAFGIVFVGALTSMLIRAVGPRAEIYFALAGGVIWLALTAAGLAAEVDIRRRSARCCGLG